MQIQIIIVLTIFIANVKLISTFSINKLKQFEYQKNFKLFSSVSSTNKKDLLTKQATILYEIWNQISFPNENELTKEFLLSDFGMSRDNVKGIINML